MSGGAGFGLIALAAALALRGEFGAREADVLARAAELARPLAGAKDARLARLARSILALAEAGPPPRLSDRVPFNGFEAARRELADAAEAALFALGAAAAFPEGGVSDG